jgi:ABC-type glycerol-3-phosphate transport system substrate-binding protein
MTKLELSIMFHNDKALEALRLALDGFERQHNVTIDLKTLSWTTGWSELVKMAIYKTGPDVSQVGTTWLEGLVSLKALRQFEKQDFDAVGGSLVFLPSVWPAESLSIDKQVYRMPYSSDTRMVFYRRNLLEQAGINEQSAFASLEQFAQTLDQLNVRQFQKNNDPKNQVGRGRIRTNHFSKPGRRSKRSSKVVIASWVNFTPVW